MFNKKIAITSVAAAAALALGLATASDANAWWWGWGWGGNDDHSHGNHEPGQHYHRNQLRGTKCWKFKAAFGKPSFMKLHFLRVREGHSMFSGTVVRADGVNKKPDRVIQVTGSGSFHSFVGDNKAEISRYLLNLNYSFSKTGTNPENAFKEVPLQIRGHYNVRLNPENLNGVFAGNDYIMSWAPPLTGPSNTFRADLSQNGYSSINGNYLGGIDCTGGSCGTILPLNNAGQLELVGRNAYQCDLAEEQFGPDFIK